MTENLDEKLEREQIAKEDLQVENEVNLDNTGESENEVQVLKNEMEELNQRLMRIAADFDNFRKRTRTEKEEFLKYANSNLISDLLPVLDNFQRALDVKEPNEEVKKFLAGTEMIYRQLMQILEQAGLTPINALGQPFDPQKHEAVMQVEDTSVSDNCILEDLRCGYMYKDKVLRPSMVKVAKNNG